MTDGSTVGEPQQGAPDSSATINLDFPSGRVTIDREREGAERGFHRYHRVVVNEDSPELWHRAEWPQMKF